MTLEDILDFARRFDPQPMHTDPDISGGVIASGWHTAAIVMRLNVESSPFGSLPVLGLGVDGIEWPRPVRPSDEISVETEVLAIRPSKSKPSHGIVKMRTTARNQNGEVVFVVTPNCWVPRRSNA
jgi:acyl dehydratase